MTTRVINKLETSLSDEARVIIYDHHMFIVQATGSTIALGCGTATFVKAGA